MDAPEHADWTLDGIFRRIVLSALSVPSGTSALRFTRLFEYCLSNGGSAAVEARRCIVGRDVSVQGQWIAFPLLSSRLFCRLQ